MTSKLIFSILAFVLVVPQMGYAQRVRVNGSTTFQYGQVQFPNGTILAPSIAFTDEPGLGFYRVSNDTLGFTTGAAGTGFVVDTTTFAMNNDSANFGIGSASTTRATWVRHASNHMGVRNPFALTTAQAFSVFNTFTSTTNYESIALDWQASTNVANIGTRVGSAGGTARNMVIGAGSTAGTVMGFLTSQSSPYVRQGFFTAAGTADQSASAAGATWFDVAKVTSTGTSGSIFGMQVSPIYNQASGTAANTDLRINRTETAIGSGAQYALETSIAATSKFSIDNQGALALRNRATITVDSATTFALSTAGSYIVLECTGAETINTITGGVTGELLWIENSDTDCTIADDDSATASNAIDLTGSANDVGAVAKVIGLIYNGTHWLQIFESDN